ncbi:MAG: hypothetical protein JKY70_11990 [Mucilaginibacter sp.]|nr:hypothetical protein [Mucilaginibacter sp.]
MKLFILQVSTSLLFALNGGGTGNMVYVCDSPNAKRYHLKEHCRGLSNCTYTIIKVSVDQAKKSGKTLCHWED